VLTPFILNKLQQNFKPGPNNKILTLCIFSKLILIIEEFATYPPVDPEASPNVPVPGKNNLNGKFSRIFFDLLN
jgi:hypothetical protein